jgi:beta-barrel assembly-enhancing protease
MALAEQSFPGGAYEGDDDSVATMGSLEVSPHGIQFVSEAFTISLPTLNLHLELDENCERVLITHPNYPGWTVYSLDLALIEHPSLRRFGLRERLEELQYEARGPSKHVVRVYAALGVLAAVVIGLWVFSNAIVSAIVQGFPAEWEAKVGAEAFKEAKEEYTLSNDPILTNRVHLLGQRLKRGLPVGAPDFKFYVADTKMVNAFALPGGTVVVLRGLLEEATAEELAGVMAHEMAHVTQRHGMRMLAQMSGPLFIAKSIFGGDSALAGMMESATVLGSLQYSREHEREADSVGWDILMRANVDPRGMTQFFRKLHRHEGGGGATDIFSTHPATVERIQALQDRWAKSPKQSGFEPVKAGEQPGPWKN